MPKKEYVKVSVADGELTVDVSAYVIAYDRYIPAKNLEVAKKNLADAEAVYDDARNQLEQKVESPNAKEKQTEHDNASNKLAIAQIELADAQTEYDNSCKRLKQQALLQNEQEHPANAQAEYKEARQQLEQEVQSHTAMLTLFSMLESIPALKEREEQREEIEKTAAYNYIKSAFDEVLKNTIDVAINKYVNAIDTKDAKDKIECTIQLKLDIQDDNDGNISVSLTDNGDGFPKKFLEMTRDSQQMQDYLFNQEEDEAGEKADRQYGSRSKTDKPSLYLGGRGKGLRMLGAKVLYNAELRAKDMIINKYEKPSTSEIIFENDPDMHGAKITIKTSNTPLIQNKEYPLGQIINFNDQIFKFQKQLSKSDNTILLNLEDSKHIEQDDAKAIFKNIVTAYCFKEKNIEQVLRIQKTDAYKLLEANFVEVLKNVIVQEALSAASPYKLNAVPFKIDIKIVDDAEIIITLISPTINGLDVHLKEDADLSPTSHKFSELALHNDPDSVAQKLQTYLQEAIEEAIQEKEIEKEPHITVDHQQKDNEEILIIKSSLQPSRIFSHLEEINAYDRASSSMSSSSKDSSSKRDASTVSVFSPTAVTPTTPSRSSFTPKKSTSPTTATGLLNLPRPKPKGNKKLSLPTVEESGSNAASSHSSPNRAEQKKSLGDSKESPFRKNKQGSSNNYKLKAPPTGLQLGGFDDKAESGSDAFYSLEQGKPLSSRESTLFGSKKVEEKPDSSSSQLPKDLDALKLEEAKAASSTKSKNITHKFKKDLNIDVNPNKSDKSDDSDDSKFTP